MSIIYDDMLTVTVRNGLGSKTSQEVELKVMLPQTITFPTFGTVTYGDEVELEATSDSGLEVTYEITPASIGTIEKVGSKFILQTLAAGDATVTASQAGNEAYLPATPVTQPLIVNKVALTVTADNKSITYGNAAPDYTVTYSGFVNAESASDLGGTLSFNCTYTKGNDAGTYDITPEGLTSGNYDIIFNKGTLTVGQVSLSVTGTTVSDKVYDGNTTATITLGTVTGVLSGDTVTITPSGAFPSENVGNQEVLVTYALSGADAGNYTAPANDTIQAAITGKGLSVTGTTVSDKVYDGNTTATIILGTVTGVLSGDTVTITPSGAFPSENVGSQEVLVTYALSGADAGNYTAPANDTVSAKIESKPAPVVWTTAAPYTYTGVDQSSTVTAKYVDISGKDVALNVSFDKTFKDAGDYTATASMVTADANYTLSNATLALTIGKANQTITFDSLAVKIYGDAAFSLNATASSELDVTYTSNNSAVATVSGNTVTIVGAGETTITASQEGNENYNAATTVAQKLTVNKATPTITTAPGASTITYGQPLSDSILTGGMATGNGVELVGTFAWKDGTIFLSAGNGQPNTVVFTPTSPSNFNGVEGSVEVNVNPKALTVAGTTVSDKVYDGNTTATITLGTVTGVLSGDTVTITPSGAFPSANVGSQEVLVAYALSGADAGNYTAPANDTIQVAITGKGLSVTGTTVSDKVYDGNTTATITLGTVTGVLSGDTVTITPSGAFPSENVGSQEVLVTYALSGANAGNYTVPANDTVSAKIESKQALVIWTTAVPYTYTGVDQSSTVTAKYVDISSKDVALNVSFDKTFKDAGDYTATASMVTADANYTLSNATLALTIGKADQTITFGVLAAKTYGDAAFDLSATADSQLNVTYTSSNVAVATVSGNTVTIVGAGETTITASQTGNENYNAATTVAQKLMVNKAMPVITWATPAPISYGTALSEAQLNATANVEGTFAYTPAAGTKVPTGDQTLSVTFTPKDSTNYTTASKSVVLAVRKCSPVITWATPAPISYGTPLSETQLNATANVEGTFVYTPAAGTKLEMGTHRLRLVFTPTDKNYYAANGAVWITVTKAIQTIEFAPLGDVEEGCEPFTLSATATSGLAVTYTSSDPSVAAITGHTVTVGKSGVAYITASQSGNDVYEAAVDVVQRLVVKVESEFEYVVNEDGTLTITGYKGTDVDVVIPSQIGEWTVAKIGERAFQVNKSLQSILIPETVVAIEKQAFQDCVLLASIIIPDSVTTIGDEAFLGCSNLTSAHLGLKVTTVGKSAFWNCNKLATVEFSKNVTTIGDYAFSQCSSLTSLVLPDSLTKIGEHAFQYCSGLTKIEIGRGLSEIGKCAFINCTSLGAVYFKGNAPTLGDRAFTEPYPVVYYLKGTKGWTNPWGGCETKLWEDEEEFVISPLERDPVTGIGYITITLPVGATLESSSDLIHWNVVVEASSGTYRTEVQKEGNVFYRIRQ